MTDGKGRRWDPPSWLGEGALAEWPGVVAELRRRRVISRATPAAVAAYCQTLVQYQRCTAAVEEHGQVLVIRNDKGVVTKEEVAPEAVLQLRLLDKLRAFWKSLGLMEGDEEDSGETQAEAGGGQSAAEAGPEAGGGGTDARARMAAHLRAIGRGGDAGRN